MSTTFNDITLSRHIVDLSLGTSVFGVPCDISHCNLNKFHKFNKCYCPGGYVEFCLCSGRDGDSEAADGWGGHRGSDWRGIWPLMAGEDTGDQIGEVYDR